MSRTILGYADRFSVAPGEKIAFKASCQGHAHYHLEIVRLISADLNPEGPGFREEVVPSGIAGNYPGRRQEIAAGSYAVVPDCAGPARAHGLFARRHDLADERPGQGLADSHRSPVAAAAASRLPSTPAAAWR